MSKLTVFFSAHKFNAISWGITLALVAGIVAGALTWKQSIPTAQAQTSVFSPTKVPEQNQPQAVLPTLGKTESLFSITRGIQLKTNVPADKPRYTLDEYRVGRGDSIFAISESFKLKPETVLWANYNILQDDPHSLKPGQILQIPPVDGIYYQWKENDTLDRIANEFKANIDDILNYPGNSIDLSDPKIESGSWVMIPNGKREFVTWLIPTIATGSSGTSSTSQTSCPGGAVGSGGFVWPADAHSISGNDYWSGHLGIDIAAGEGAPIYAADSGVVTMAQGGYNYGYGNVIQINHGNGYSTLYAHLSVIGVSPCQSVGAGEWIGASGNTGNSQGAHLHFEVRQNGGFINPWYILP